MLWGNSANEQVVEVIQNAEDDEPEVDGLDRYVVPVALVPGTAGW
jgi:hypothetical protein